MSSFLSKAQTWFWVAVAWTALLVWLAIGAAMLSALEQDSEKRRITEYCQTISSMISSMDVTQKESWGNLLQSVSQAGICRQPQCDGLPGAGNGTNATVAAVNATATAADAAEAAAVRLDWDFAGAWFYLLTTFTTIGYGTYVPTTAGGKALTVPLALVGIILFTMANGLLALRLRAHVKQTAGTERKTTVLLGFCSMAWMLLMAAVYSEYEGWSYFDALWFAFISTTTIGLGDFAPAVMRDWVSNYLLIVGGLVFTAATLMSIVANVGDHLAKEEAKKPCCTGLRKLLNSLARTMRAAVSWIVVFFYTLFGAGMLSTIEGEGGSLTLESFRKGIENLRPDGENFQNLQAQMLNSTGLTSLSGSVGTALALLNAQGTCPPPEADGVTWGIFPSMKFCFSLLTTVGCVRSARRALRPAVAVASAAAAAAAAISADMLHLTCHTYCSLPAPRSWGDLAPKTVDGKVFSIFFALLGFVVFGTASARTAALLHEHLVEKLGTTEDPEKKKRLLYRLRYVIAGFAMLFLWWLVTSVIFSSTEKWSFGTSFWFSFVTMSTIGFGDKSPTFSGVTFIIQWAFLSFGLKLFALVLASARHLITEDAATVQKKLQQAELRKGGLTGVKAIV
jgi:hypothetical protein